MSGAHSYLPPSGAACWTVCHAWPLYNAMYPGSDNELSIEGQEAHEEARKSLQSYQQPDGELYIPADPDVRMYVNYVLKLVQEFGGLQAMRVEQSVHIGLIHNDCYGTPDVWIFDQTKGVLHIVDLKFGYGIVEAFENWQLIAYALGAMPEVLDEKPPIRVKLHIVQPRAAHPEGPIRTWETQGVNLRNYMNQAAYAAGMIMNGDQTATPGTHCLNCPGRHQCPAAQRWANKAADFAMQAQFVDLTPEQLGRELLALDIAAEAIEARRAGLFAQAEAMALNGQSVYGWHLKESAGRLNWTVPESVVFATGDMLGVDLRVTKPCTPTQAIGAGIDESVIHAYATRTTGRKLTRVNTDQLRKIFQS